MYPYFNQQFVPGWNQVQPQQAPQVPQQVPMRQLITPDQETLLKENSSKRDGFFIPVSPLEEAVNMCTHKHRNGAFAVTEPDSDGYRTCTICKSKFRLVEPDEMSQAEIAQLVARLVDIFESIKLFKGDIDPEVGSAVYQALSVLKQIPGMYKNASEFIKRAVSGPQTGMGMYQRGPSPLGMYNMIYYGGYQQPMYAPQAQAPAFQTQAQQPVQQQPVAPQMVVQQPVAPQMVVPQQQPVYVPQGYVVQQQPQQPVQQGYVPVAPLTPVVGVPGQAMTNPIGHVVATQAQAPAAPQAPVAAPQTVVVATPDEPKK